jgi:hypothetical protein
MLAILPTFVISGRYLAVVLKIGGFFEELGHYSTGLQPRLL